MLSYKHGYHAGNHADVMKHIIMLYLYNLEKKVNNSISYIDTHSGNGIYKSVDNGKNWDNIGRREWVEASG